MDASNYTIDLAADHLVKVSSPEIPGLDPKFWPAPKTLRRWIRAGRLAALCLPGGLVTSLEALAASGAMPMQGQQGQPPPARPAKRSTAARRRERAASTAATLAAEGLA